MASRSAPTLVPYVEPVPVGEEFVSGLANFEIIGDVTFLVFYIDQIAPPELEMVRERRIVRRMIIPNDGVSRMRRMLDAHGGSRPVLTE